MNILLPFGDFLVNIVWKLGFSYGSGQGDPLEISLWCSTCENENGVATKWVRC